MAMSPARLPNELLKSTWDLFERQNNPFVRIYRRFYSTVNVQLHRGAARQDLMDVSRWAAKRGWLRRHHGEAAVRGAGYLIKGAPPRDVALRGNSPRTSRYYPVLDLTLA
ncbi:hypothetical protein BJX76DRAFT_167059 [Aspergillus varians]